MASKQLVLCFCAWPRSMNEDEYESVGLCVLWPVYTFTINGYSRAYAIIDIYFRNCIHIYLYTDLRIYVRAQCVCVYIYMYKTQMLK